MITRIHLFKLDASFEGRLPSAASALHGEVAGLEGPLSAEVGVPADAASAKSWDLSLVLSFADAGDAEAFLGGDALRNAVQRALGGGVVVEKAWSFAVLGR